MSRYRLSAVLAVLALLVAVMPTSALAGNHGGGNPNEDCTTGPLVAKFQWRGGSYVFEKPDGNAGVVTITGGTAEGGSWSSTEPIGSVIVKGSTDANVTVYDPAVFSGTFSNANLSTPGPNGNTPGISNVQFCGVVPQEPGVGTLVVAKTVVGDEPQGASYRVEVACAGFDVGPGGVADLAAGGSATVSTEIPDGTACTVTETIRGGADDTNGTVTVNGGAPAGFTGTSTAVTILEDTTTTVTFTNTFDDTVDTPTGTLAVEKVVTGEGEPAADASFAVEVACEGVDLGGAGDLSFGREGGVEALGADLPEGTACTVTETVDGGAATTLVAVDPAGDEAGDTGTSAAVTVVAGATRVVRFTNVFEDDTVVPADGSLAVEKVVAGEGEPAADASFVVEVACEGVDLGGAGDLSFGRQGGAEGLGVDLPEGTECTVTETDAGGADLTFVVVDPDGDDLGEEGATATVTIVAGEATHVRFTNAFGFDEVLASGSLVVEKVVAGDGEPAADASFVVEVACDGVNLHGAGELSFDREGGERLVSATLADGVECTVTETGAGGADASFVVVDPEGDERGDAGAAATVTITAGVTTRVRVTNVFDGDQPGPTTTPTPTPTSADRRDETEVLGPTPTRIDAGAGGAAQGGFPLRGFASLLLGAAAAALAVNQRRRRLPAWPAIPGLDGSPGR